MMCKVEGCADIVRSKGLCKLHYQRQWRIGAVEVTRACRHGAVMERFWRHVDRRGDDECWPWTGFRDKDGYGKFRQRRNGKRQNRGAHIVSWEIHNGPVPDGMMVLHKCNNEPCCNPKHLKSGDHMANMADRLAVGNYQRGERHHQTRFSDEIVRAIRRSDETARALASRYGMSESQVGNIRHGRQRRSAVAFDERNDEGKVA